MQKNVTNITRQPQLFEGNLTSKKPFDVLLHNYNTITKTEFNIHPICCLVIVLEGKFLQIYEKSMHIIKKGEFYYEGIWEPHGGKNLEPFTKLLVIIFLPEFILQEPDDIKLLIPFISRFSKNRPKSFNPHSTKLNVLSLADDILHLHTKRPNNWENSIRLNLKRILIELLNQCKGIKTHSPLNSYNNFKKIEPALKTIYKYSQNDMHLHNAADISNLSKPRFNEIFKKTMGTSFFKFHMQIKLHMAIRDIILGKDKMETIATRWGFYDNSHFHHLFKKFFLKTPQEYINQFSSK
ncbi:MAG: AraC family transcriptional regulator [Candidatus Firestonebacteria bacterium]